jgi:hypothetical protein
MRAAVGLALSLSLAIVACGALLGNDEDAPSTETGPSADGSVPGVIDDASAADGGTTTSRFCETRTGWTACEDFEPDLPPTRGWTATTMDGGPTIEQVASDRAGGGRTAHVTIPTGTAPYARLYVDLPVSKATTKAHAEVTTKVQVGATGIVSLARLEMHDLNAQALSAEVILYPPPQAPIANFCHPTGNGSGNCTPIDILEPLDGWRSLAFDLDTSGKITVTVDRHAYSDGVVGDIGLISSAAAFVGPLVSTAGAEQVLWFDDALASVQ